MHLAKLISQQCSITLEMLQEDIESAAMSPLNLTDEDCDQLRYQFKRLRVVTRLQQMINDGNLPAIHQQPEVEELLDILENIMETKVVV